jgi:hypothetical protein
MRHWVAACGMFGDTEAHGVPTGAARSLTRTDKGTRINAAAPTIRDESCCVFPYKSAEPCCCMWLGTAQSSNSIRTVFEQSVFACTGPRYRPASSSSVATAAAAASAVAWPQVRFVMCEEDSLETVMRGLDRWEFFGYLLDRSSIHHIHVILGSFFLSPCFQLWGKR